MKTLQQIKLIAKKRFEILSNENNDLGIREHNQIMHDKQSAFIDGFLESLDTSSMNCGICGELFDPSNLTSVLFHEHKSETNHVEAIGIHGVKMGNELYPNEGPDFWAGVNTFILGYPLEQGEQDDFNRGWFQAQKDSNL